MALRVILAVTIIQAILTFILALFMKQQSQVLSLIYGSIFSIVNFVLLVCLWKLIFNSSKKRVALAIFLIVIKYAILVWVFTRIPKENTVDSLEFAIGIIANPMAVICLGLSYKFFRQFFYVKK